MAGCFYEKGDNDFYGLFLIKTNPAILNEIQGENSFLLPLAES